MYGVSFFDPNDGSLRSLAPRCETEPHGRTLSTHRTPSLQTDDAIRTVKDKIIVVYPRVPDDTTLRRGLAGGAQTYPASSAQEEISEVVGKRTPLRIISTGLQKQKERFLRESIGPDWWMAS